MRANQLDRLKRSTGNREKILLEAIDKVYAWYILQRGVPYEAAEQLPKPCEYVHPITKEVTIYFEPQIVGIANPVITEYSIGNDSWACRIDMVDRPIRSVGGL